MYSADSESTMVLQKKNLLLDWYVLWSFGGILIQENGSGPGFGGHIAPRDLLLVRLVYSVGTVLLK